MNFTVNEGRVMCNTYLMLVFFLFGQTSLHLLKMTDPFLGFIHQSKHENSSIHIPRVLV